MAAAAAMSATSDVAVRDEGDDVLAPVNAAPKATAPDSRRGRRAPATPAVDVAAHQAASAVPDETHPFAQWFAAGASESPADASVAAEEPQAEPVTGEPAASEHETCDASDPFLEAVRAFGATGETPVVTPQPASRVVPEHVAQGRAVRSGRVRRIATTALASVGVMGIVGMLAVGLTTPVGAVAAPAAVENPAAVAATATGAERAAGSDEDIQAFVAPADVAGEALEVTAEFESETFAEIAAAEGINTANAAFTNDPTADIQWPFSVGVGISSYYGYRWGRLHEGVDFVPGNGAPVQAIADGTVRIATESGGAYGVTVYIDHVIDGQLVTSHYAHMQYGSLRVVAGQQVKVGDIVGLTGNTGRSYGAHMHFEIIIGGTTIDPLPWLQQWANTHYPEEQIAGAETATDDASATGDGE